MKLWERTQEAAKFLQQHITAKPRIAIVLGSGMGSFCDTLTAQTTIAYQDIPHFPRSTVAGHEGLLCFANIHDIPCVILSGRVHYYEGYTADDVGFSIRVLHALGLPQVLLTNAAGGINSQFVPGDLMVIKDHLNLTGISPLCGMQEPRFGSHFVDMNHAYAASGRQALWRASRDIGLTLHEGVYAGLLGPHYETPAEVRMLKGLGADAVGMSTVTEVIIARQLGMQVTGLSIITNYAAGLSDDALTHEHVTTVAQRTHAQLYQLLNKTVAYLA